jgi:hypothetical protein
MAQTIANVYAHNMEVVRKDLPALYEMAAENTVYSKIKKGSDNIQIVKTPNGQDFRIPVETQPPGYIATASLDGGALPGGSATITQQMYQTYFPLFFPVDIGVGSIWNTEASNSTVNEWKNNMKKAIPAFKRQCDASFFNLGSGSQGLMALATGYAAGVFTLDTEYGASLCQLGQRVEIFSNDLGTNRTSSVPTNLPYISAIDRDAGTVTVTNLGAITPQATDYLAFAGAGGTGTTLAWVNGLNYFHNTATSGSVLGLDRATYPEINPNKVDASGSLVPTHGLLLNTKIRVRTGEMPSKLFGVIHPAQAAQIYSTGIAISEWNRGGSDKMIDIMPSDINDDYIKWCGVAHLKSNRQSKKRVDWVDLNNVCRVYLKELDFYTGPNGQKFFEGRNGDGAVTLNWQYWLYVVENFAFTNPRQSGFVYNASIPSGF